MKVSIKFSLVSGKASDLPIRIRIGYAGRRLDLRTGFVCPPDKWDAEAMRMKPGSSNRYKESAATINRELSKFESAISEILTRFELDGVTPEPEVLKREFDRRFGRDTSPAKGTCTLMEAFKLYMSDSSHSMSPSSTKAYMTALKNLEDFAFATRPLDTLTSEDLSDFVSELWAEEKENQTVSLYLARIRTVLRFAKLRKLYTGTLHLEFRPRLKGIGKKDVHYLEWEEFEKILSVKLRAPMQIATRDAFCFCCATGLRISDCVKLKWSDVHLCCDAPHISIVAKKTTKPTIIELNKYSRAVLERQQRKPGDEDKQVFPPVCQRAMNDNLHRIAKAAGIEGQVRKLSFSGSRVSEKTVDKCDAITTHWGRHTFIVHALSIGISPSIVMQWTGHSSYESMKPYVAIVDSARKSSMELFDK